MFKIDRNPTKYSTLEVKASDINEVISHMGKILDFLGATYCEFDDYHAMKIHLSFTEDELNLYEFIKTHASSEQILEFNNWIRENIVELECAVNKNRRNIIR